MAEVVEAELVEPIVERFLRVTPLVRGRAVDFDEAQIFGPLDVCVDVDQGLPVLRAWRPGTDELLLELPLAPEACRKLAGQALCAADANAFEQIDPGPEGDRRPEIVRARGRYRGAVARQRSAPRGTDERDPS